MVRPLPLLQAAQPTGDGGNGRMAIGGRGGLLNALRTASFDDSASMFDPGEFFYKIPCLTRYRMIPN